MARAGVHPNPGKDLHIVSINQTQPSFRVQLDKLQHIIRIDAAVFSAGLPRLPGVISKLFFLNPHRRLGKQIDATQVVPVGVADHHVGHIFGLHSGKFHRFVRPQEIGDGKIFGPLFAMKSAVEKDVVAAAANQPNYEGDVHLLVFRCANDEFVGREARRIPVANRLNGVFRCHGCREHRGYEHQECEQQSVHCTAPEKEPLF